MKATSGRLSLAQSYELVSCSYNGRYKPDEFALPSACCDNCDNPISNIATVRGSVDGREYRIGLDCAAVLTGIAPDEIAQAKKRMLKEAQFHKWLSFKMVSFIIIEGRAYLFEMDLDKGDYEEMDLRRWSKWSCDPKKYGSLLPGNKEYVIASTRQEKFEYSDGTYEVYTVVRKEPLNAR